MTNGNYDGTLVDKKMLVDRVPAFPKHVERNPAHWYWGSDLGRSRLQLCWLRKIVISESMN